MLVRRLPYWLSTALVIGLASLPPAPATAQAIGYGYLGSHLAALELLPGSPAYAPYGVGDTAISGVSALAMGPAGILYAAVVDPIGPETLWTVDPSTLETQEIGDLGVALADEADLAAGTGGLWLVAGGVLYSVDTASGLATAVSGEETDLAAIAVRDGTLFGIAGSLSSGWTLVEVDPATAALTPVAAIPGIEDWVIFTFIVDAPTAMDFDDDGGLWTLVLYLAGVLGSPVPHTELYYLADPATGEVTSHAGVGDDLWWRSLAVAGSPSPPVEVPALDGAGLALFALALTTAMVVFHRRRSTVHRGTVVRRRGGKSLEVDVAAWFRERARRSGP